MGGAGVLAILSNGHGSRWMRFFFVTQQNEGPAKWRALIPAKYLARRGHEVRFFGDGGCAPEYYLPDVVVFFLDAKDMEDAVPWCKANGIGIVFETDDALDAVSASNPAYWSAKVRLGRYDYILEQADVVTTTTPHLANRLFEQREQAGLRWWRDVFVLPNSVDPEEWPTAATLTPPRPAGDPGLRVGWSGGSSHLNDLGKIIPAVRDAQKQRPFTFVVQGLLSAEGIPAGGGLEDKYRWLAEQHGQPFIDSPFAMDFRWLLQRIRECGLKIEFHPFVLDVREHAAALAALDLDIGLAPLLDSEFNRCKSVLKHYEYSMVGAATLASRVPPYDGEVPITAKNNRGAWANALVALIDSDRQALVKWQREWVLAERNMERNIGLWEEAYRTAAETAQLRSATVAKNATVGVEPLRFLIWGWDYSTASGGGLALHRLADRLAALGHEARITCKRTASGWLGEPTDRRTVVDEDEIAIYPEIVCGNPFQAQRVVRWILNIPGLLGGDGVYGPDDLLMLWSEAYRTPAMAAHRVGGLLTVWRDYSAFKDMGGPRRGICYAVRKGTGKVLDQHPADALCIDDYDRRGKDDYLVPVFNQHERFICYDHATTLSTLAALCGCPTLVVPDGVRTREQVESDQGGPLNGIAWGMEDWARAVATLPAAREGLERLIAISDEQVGAFVKLCCDRWDGAAHCSTHL